MYELGLAHAFNKKTIVITKDAMSSLPFDLKQYRAKDYTTHFKKFSELMEYLKTTLEGAMNGTVLYSNPVKDFLLLGKIKVQNWFEETSSITIENSTESGFLDFLANIDTNANQLSEELIEMTKDMGEMSEGISECTSEIERVKKSGGSGTSNFVRKEAKKAAAFVDAFSSKLRVHNKTTTALWDQIEQNTLGLLENKIAVIDDNKLHLVEYLRSLYSMKIAIDGTRDSVVGLKGSMHKSIGLERSMNQAIKFVNEDLSTFLDITDRMNASITKILEKSKFVVGVIDFES